jgi:hypothetical protein
MYYSSLPSLTCSKLLEILFFVVATLNHHKEPYIWTRRPGAFYDGESDFKYIPIHFSLYFRVHVA